MVNAFKQIQVGGKPLSTDVDQFRLAFSGSADIGNIQLFAPIANPSAPTLSLNATSGVLNGTYYYEQVNVTGWVGSDGTFYVNGFAPSSPSASIAPVNQQVNVTLTTGPSGTIARILYRTVAGGSTYKFLTWIGDNTTTSFIDNIADGSLGTGMPSVSGATTIPATAPTTNTTGSYLMLPNLASQPPIEPANTLCIVNNTLYISNGTTWVAMSSGGGSGGMGSWIG